MKNRIWFLLLGIVSLVQAAEEAMRPPSVPLVACDPYFSVWSPFDKLNEGDTTHWTGKSQRMVCDVVIDGKPHRLMGKSDDKVPALEQKGLEVFPTKTRYIFQGAGMNIRLTFLTPALPEDIAILSRPVTYVSCEAVSADGAAHDVSVKYEVYGEIATNNPDQKVKAENMEENAKLHIARVGSVAQRILNSSGDDHRIDWGHCYVAILKNQTFENKTGYVIEGALAKDSKIFVESKLGKVEKTPASTWWILAYDDEYSIQYMKNNLRPYWRKDGWTAKDLLEKSAEEYDVLSRRCAAFDAELLADLRHVGGENYANLGALAYRECFAAGKFVADENGQPLQFSKENHSNGCIATSDVFYPMAPQFLLLSPTLAKSFIVPFMNYAASPRWKFPFAPHDLGTYPLANGQVYGGGERDESNQMPVEESGNLLILFAAVAEMEGNANFANLYWKQLKQWAEYLKEKGFDPENQLCTDDFAGHLAHNVNLSAKAICALGSYAKLCDYKGEKAEADEYKKIAKEFAEKWIKEADAGTHTRLAFDQKDSWSQKYNLVWDGILGLNLFPQSVKEKELAFYLKKQNKYGLPLDNRKDYTKLDWTVWTATLTQKRSDFDALLAPIMKMIQETKDRSPLTDWYETKDAKKVGFTARPVIGGVFINMLYQKDIWKKYAARDLTKSQGWAALPVAPEEKIIVPPSFEKKESWSYTFSKPSDGWEQPSANVTTWKTGEGGFGTKGTPNANVGTLWNTPDIWLRRDVELPANVNLENLHLYLHHDDDCQVYLNGKLAHDSEGFTSQYDSIQIPQEVKNTLKGKVTIAIHVRQDHGGQFIDCGFSEVSKKK